MRQRVQDLRTRTADGGFTLVELLIVVIVLGILAGIVVFGVANFKGDAEKAACKADVKTVQVAMEAYNAQNGAYPTTLAQLTGAGLIKTAPANVKIEGDTAKGQGTCA